MALLSSHVNTHSGMHLSCYPMNRPFDGMGRIEEKERAVSLQQQMEIRRWEGEHSQEHDWDR